MAPISQTFPALVPVPGFFLLQEEGGGSQYELLTLFADGGVMMYFLVLASLVALGVIIAKLWTLWVAHRSTQTVLREVEEATRAGRIDDALKIAAETPGPAAAVLLAGLRRIRERRVREGEIEQAVNTTGTIELGFLERGLVILATVANVAPLMGFLGTVAGMILAFAAIEQAGDVDPTLVAGGIKVALLTTAAGLIIAVPSNVFYNFFVSRIDQLILDMERGAQEVLNLAWDLEKQGEIEVIGHTRRGVGGATAATRRHGAVGQPSPDTMAPSPPSPEKPRREPGGGGPAER